MDVNLNAGLEANLWSNLPKDAYHVVAEQFYAISDELAIHSTDKTTRARFYERIQQDTQKKIGLYQRNLFGDYFPQLLQFGR